MRYNHRIRYVFNLSFYILFSLWTILSTPMLDGRAYQMLLGPPIDIFIGLQ